MRELNTNRVEYLPRFTWMKAFDEVDRVERFSVITLFIRLNRALVQTFLMRSDCMTFVDSVNAKRRSPCISQRERRIGRYVSADRSV
jgi:predicted NUDIX family NTP pyrophosphohydrolase